MISRRKNPLDRPGPRRWLACSPIALAAIRDAAAAHRVTQRIVLDELLEDMRLVNAAAARAAARLAGIESRTGDRG